MAGRTKNIVEEPVIANTVHSNAISRYQAGVFRGGITLGAKNFWRKFSFWFLVLLYRRVLHVVTLRRDGYLLRRSGLWKKEAALPCDRQWFDKAEERKRICDGIIRLVCSRDYSVLCESVLFWKDLNLYSRHISHQPATSRQRDSKCSTSINHPPLLFGRTIPDSYQRRRRQPYCSHSRCGCI